MVLEIADFTVKSGTEDAFAAAVEAGLPHIAATPGFLGARLTRGIESPSRFVLLIEWESLEAHTVGVPWIGPVRQVARARRPLLRRRSARRARRRRAEKLLRRLGRSVVVLAYRRRVVHRSLLACAVAVLALLATATPAAAADQVRVEEQRLEGAGVTLDTSLYLPATTPAPAVLVAHGFGGTKASVDADARDLAARGFVVLTWTARGFGASSGQIALDTPDAEVADARKLVDWLAGRPEVQQDGPGDPRVGVTGGSYGGALSLMLAGYDKRIDAIAPVITWNDLGQALFPNAATTSALPADTPARGAFAPDGVFKRGWAGVFFASGRSAQPAPGTVLTCGRFIPVVCAAYTEAATTGRISPTTAALLGRSSPASVTDRITAPTLLVQGEQDTLFGLDQADANARQIAAHGTPVKVTWYAGGHDGGGARPGRARPDRRLVRPLARGTGAALI